MKYACCFCGETILSDTYGITSLVAISNWDKDVYEQQEQQFFCHIDCLKKALHVKVPLYLADLKD